MLTASCTHLCDHHRNARRGEEEHNGMVAQQLLLQHGHLLRFAGAPSALLHGGNGAATAEWQCDPNQAEFEVPFPPPPPPS